MKKKVLLIDDSKTQLGTLKLMFIKAGFNVYTASNGSDGFCEVFNVAPDIIVSDIIMPNLNGYQLCRLVKNNPLTKKIPVILLTVLEQKIDKFWGTKSGADKFVSKVAPMEEIISACNELIQNNPLTEQDKSELLSEKVLVSSVQEQLNNILDDSLILSSILNEFRKLSNNVDDEHKLSLDIFSLLSSILDYDIACLTFKKAELEQEFIYIDSAYDISDSVKSKIVSDVFYNMEKVKIEDVNVQQSNVAMDSFNIQIDSFEKFQTKLVTPIYHGDTYLATFVLYKIKKINYKSFKFYDVILNELKLLARMKNLYSETRYLSITDGLTHLYNRRYFDETIEREYLRAVRYNKNLTLCLIDVDFFKKINDNYGHKMGDFVLYTLAQMIVKNFRKTDYIFRFGGEEIMVLLPEIDTSKALIPTERLRKSIQEFLFEFGELSINLTVSMGLADNRKDVDSYEDLIKNSDTALYKAKNLGRNRIISYESIS